MKHGLKTLHTRTQMQFYIVTNRYPTPALSNVVNANVVKGWRNYVLSQHPSLTTMQAHKVALQIVKRPAYMSYTTALSMALAEVQ